MLNEPNIDPAVLAVARTLVIDEQLASVALVQRHFRISYGAASHIMQVLENDGIVTAPAATGMRALAPAYQDGSATFRAWAVSEFAGCDGGDRNAKVWVLGAEHGDSRADGPATATGDDGYPIARQRTYRFNVKVFKLLAAINGMAVTDWPILAERDQPFVRGARGYFKGNLYPYPCNKEVKWEHTAQVETGFGDKERYRAWCRNHCFPVLRQWIASANPELIIACGMTHLHDYANVAFDGAAVELREHLVDVPGRTRRFFSASRNGRLLIVLPHLSGSPLFNAHLTLQAAGNQIAELMRSASGKREEADLKQ